MKTKPTSTAEKRVASIPPGHENKICPVIMYPFTHPEDTHDLKRLYEGLFGDKGENERMSYARPLTIVNQQTSYRNTKWRQNSTFMELVSENDGWITQFSDIEYTWSVDTCQMWLAGLGRAYHRGQDAGDVYWLIPGDFNYADPLVGDDVLRALPKLPLEVRKHELAMCLGEISVPTNSSKQLIDTYGTYGLLYNWFPAQAQVIKNFTEKPRSEFFAISRSYLREMLDRRWYPYEQTLVMLLEAASSGKIAAKQVTKIALGGISDLTQGRDSLAAAMQQVERIERVLKLYWREVNQEQDRRWPDRFRQLDAQSEEIRDAALIILEQILRR